MAKGNNGLLGHKHSQETIEKIRLNNLGKVISPESRLKMSIAHIGIKRKPHTEATKLKMSLASKGKPKSDTHRQALSVAFKGRKGFWKGKKRLDMTGPKNHKWIFDRTKLVGRHEEARGTSAHRDWSKNVKNRDGWKCKISNGDCSGRLEAHHILGWKSYPELRYQTNNGIALCHFHHPRKRADEKKLSPYFQSLVASVDQNR